MNIPDEARRRLVWLALADLYLDTELQEDDFRRIAAVCAVSGFSWPEIRQINYNEVAPVLWNNLLSMAGAWLGWDEEVLVEAVKANYPKRPQQLFWSRRLWVKIIDYFTADWLARIATYLP